MNTTGDEWIMQNITGFGKKPTTMLPDADLVMKQRILLKNIHSATLNPEVQQSLNSILLIIQENLELHKGYLAVLKDTSQRTFDSPSISRQELRTVMGHQSVILSEALEMTWNMSESLASIVRYLAEKKT